jgi:hypothetical protein
MNQPDTRRLDDRPGAATRRPPDAPAVATAGNPLCRWRDISPEGEGESKRTALTRRFLGAHRKPLPRGSSRRSRVRGFYGNAARQQANRSAHPARRQHDRRQHAHIPRPGAATRRPPDAPAGATAGNPLCRWRDISPEGEGESKRTALTRRFLGAHRKPLPRGSSRRSRVRGFYGNAARQHANRSMQHARRHTARRSAHRAALAGSTIARPPDVPASCRFIEHPLCRCATSPPREKEKARTGDLSRRDERTARTGEPLWRDEEKACC